MPKVSVIIPVYGVEKYIERCATSLFEQTLDNIEFIFIDDCTLDNSISILKKVVDKYTFHLSEKNHIVRVEKMPTNSGLAAVRKHGLQLATGSYIIHCDSDDWVEADMYRIMYERAVNEGSDVVICDFNNTDGITFSQSVKGCYSDSKEQCFYDMLYHKISWAVWNKLIKKETYDSIEYYPKFAMGEDMVLITQTILNSRKISYVGESLYNYYFNQTSIMNIQTERQCMNKFLQLKDNTEILLPILNSKLDKKYFKKIENILSYNMTITLFPYIYKREFFLLWKQEMLPCYRILFDRNVKLIFKIMYLLVAFRIYPLYKYLKYA